MSTAEQAIQHLDRLGSIILDDVGDGPTPADFAAVARAARDAIAPLGVAALTQLGGLIAGVAESMVAGATEWNPALGGTLMAAVDDLRHLAGRASQFTDEDSEHLAHRASELQPYVKSAAVSSPSMQPAPRSEATNGLQVDSTKDPVVDVAPTKSAPSPEPVPAKEGAQDDKTSGAKVVPISDLFFADSGPHIVSGGTPKEAATRSDLLGRGIDALDNLTMKPIAKQVTFAAIEVVPVETLLYRGRAALERAAAIREQIRSAGGAAAPAVLDEMYDLIGLALKD